MAQASLFRQKLTTGADLADRTMAELLKQQLEAADGSPESVQLLRAIVLGDAPNDVDAIKVKEQALQRLCDALVQQQDAAALRALLADLRPLFGALPKAKTAKIVRTVIDSIAKVPGSVALQVRESPPAQCTPCH